MAPRRENPTQPPSDGPGDLGQPQLQNAARGRGAARAAGAGAGRAAYPPGGRGAQGRPRSASRGRGPVPRPPPVLGGIQPGFVQRAASAVAGRGADPGRSPSRVNLSGGQIAGRGLTVAGIGTPPRAGLASPLQGASPSRPLLTQLALELGAAAGEGGEAPGAVHGVPAQLQIFQTPGDRGKRPDEEYSSPEDPRQSSRQRVDGGGASSSRGEAAGHGELPAGRQEQPAVASRSTRDWQRQGMEVGIVRNRGEDEARRRADRGAYEVRHARHLRAEAMALQAIPNADPANPLVNYGHRKWPIAMESDTFYTSVLMLDVWPRGLNWQDDATHVARCRKLIQEFQQTGLPQTVHADCKHEAQDIPHPSTVTPAYKCSCWKKFLGNLWFLETDASLLRKVGPDWGAENQNLFIHLLKRLLTAMTRHYIKNSPLFLTNNPTNMEISKAKKKSLWSADCKQVLTKVLEIRGIDRVEGMNWGLRPADKTLVSQLTGLEVPDVTKRLRGLMYMRDKKKGAPPLNEDQEVEEGDEEEEDENPEAQQPEQPAPTQPAANAPYTWTTEENYYWDSYLLAQRILNPEFTKSMITPEIYTKFRNEICRFPDHPQINGKIATYINHFLSRSKREAPRRGLKLCTEAVAAYNAIAVKNGGAPYDPRNGANNNRDWCNVAVNTTLRLLRRRNEEIQGGVPGSPSDYEARDNAAMQEDDPGSEDDAAPEAAPGPRGSPGMAPVGGRSISPGPQVPAVQSGLGGSDQGRQGRRDGDGDEDSMIRRQLFVGPDSAAAQYQRILEERLQGPDNDPQDQINNLLGLSPSASPQGPQPAALEIPPLKPLPGPAGDIVQEFYADRRRRMSIDPSDGSEPPEPPGLEVDESEEPSALEFIEMYDWVAANHPDMLKYIQWPHRLREFSRWVNEKWPDMIDYVRWPRLNPTDPPDLPGGDLAAAALPDDDLNINLEGDGCPADGNIDIGDEDPEFEQFLGELLQTPARD